MAAVGGVGVIDSVVCRYSAVGSAVARTPGGGGCRDQRRFRILVQQRAFPVAVAGRWELPGGRVEGGEDETAAVVRECHEELGVDVLVGDRVGMDVPISGERFLLRAYLAEVISGEPVACEHRSLRWLTAGELDTVEWLPADRVLVSAVRDLLTGST